MKTLNSYIKIKPFTVEIDDCPQIRELSKKARKFRLFEFHDKLRAIKKLTCDAMVNAYEEIVVWGRKANEFEETRKKHEKFKNRGL